MSLFTGSENILTSCWPAAARPLLCAGMDPSVMEPLRALADIVSGVRRLFLALIESLPAAPAPPEDDEAPEEGPALLGSRLRCIVSDRLDPTLADLEAMIEEPPETPPSPRA